MAWARVLTSSGMMIFSFIASPKDTANSLRPVETRHSPPWPRRGGCASNQMARSLTRRRRRGGWFNPPTIIGSRTNHPVRSNKGGFATFLLLSRPPLLCQGGECLASTDDSHAAPHLSHNVFDG